MEDHKSQRDIYNRKKDYSIRVVKFRTEGIVYEKIPWLSPTKGFAFEGEVDVSPEF